MINVAGHLAKKMGIGHLYGHLGFLLAVTLKKESNPCCFVEWGAIVALNFRCFRNKKTGQVIYAEAGRFGNFKNAVKKLVNYIRYNIPYYYIAHVTLTVAENTQEIDYKNLHRVTQFISQRLKRVGSDFKYVAVKELQERGALHYHLLCVYSKPRVFPSSNDIHSSWGLGFVKITSPKLRMKLNKIIGYIGKYIGKGYEYDSLGCEEVIYCESSKTDL